MDFSDLIGIMPDEDIIYYSLLNLSELAEILTRKREVPIVQPVPAPAPAQTIVMIGQTGEQMIIDLINYPVDIVSSNAFNMDLRIRSRVGIILVEVKNYSNVVPSKEYTKFLRDVSLNQNIIGALFISINSEIAGRRGIIQFENLWGDGPIIVSLVSRNSDNINGVIALIEDYAEARHGAELDRERIAANIESISNYNNDLLTATKAIHDAKDIINKSLDAAAQIIYNTEMNIRRLLREAHNTIHEFIQPMTTDILRIDDMFNCLALKQGVLTNIVFQEFLIMMIRHISTTEMLVLSIDKSSVEFVDSITCKVKPLKTKLIFMIKLEHGIVIPRDASYKDGWVSFEITKKNMMRDSIINLVNAIRA